MPTISNFNTVGPDLYLSGIIARSSIAAAEKSIQGDAVAFIAAFDNRRNTKSDRMILSNNAVSIHEIICKAYDASYQQMSDFLVRTVEGLLEIE